MMRFFVALLKLLFLWARERDKKNKNFFFVSFFFFFFFFVKVLQKFFFIHSFTFVRPVLKFAQYDTLNYTTHLKY